MQRNLNKSVIAKEVLQFQIQRNVINLAKKYLEQIEDLKATHDNAIQSIRGALPKEYAPLLDVGLVFDDKQMEIVRKRILDGANAARRELELLLERLEIEWSGNF